MISLMTRIMILLAETKKFTNGFPSSRASDAASPTSMANTIRASMFCLERRWIKSGTVNALTI